MKETARRLQNVFGPPLRRQLEALAAEQGCEILEVDFRGGTLRFVLDHSEGVTLEHCESFSKQASALLDVDDWGEGAYVLEVSSPGLDRKLYGPEDYRRFLGRLARVTFREADSGQRRTIVGILDAFSEQGEAVLSLRNKDDGEPVGIPLSSVEVARLEIDL